MLRDKDVIVYSVLVSIILRFAIGFGPYSGEATPPKYGDYEAQRHFMEIALNYPISQWYRYDPSYWGLDYPPLTAYHSWVIGYFASVIDPAWMKPVESRGFESKEHKLFMRTSVVISDILYIASIIYFYKHIRQTLFKQHDALHLIALLSPPALLIIDHGHFQYNSVMLGFTMWSINFIVQKRIYMGAFCFCMALGFKHMSLYYALAFFAYLFGTCLAEQGVARRITMFVKLGIVVLFSLGGLLLPFLVYDGVDGVVQVFRRLFPFERGIFEDKVANFWVATSPILKLKGRVAVDNLLKFSALLTLAACMPSVLYCIRFTKPKAFLITLASCSLSFFLFSFQVHEKSILIPLLPIILLGFEEPELLYVFTNFSMFSMSPLLIREGNHIGYFCLLALWNISFRVICTKKINMFIRWVPVVIITVIHLFEAFVKPPARYPHLFIMINMMLSAAVFFLSYAYLNMKLYTRSPELFHRKLKSK